MTCRSFEDAIVEIARGREAGRGTVAAVEVHVEQCAACAARLSRERELSDGLRALAAATASAAPSDALEQRLRAAFEAQYPATTPRWWKVAAAAALLIAAGGWWWTSRETGVALRPDAGVRATTAPTLPTPPASAVAATRESTPRDDASLTVRRERLPAGRRRPATAQAEFVALPAAVGLPPFESGVIVRVELPLSALPAYGLEMVPGRKAPVEADFLIGQDGQARAIRLVNRSIARSGAEQ